MFLKKIFGTENRFKAKNPQLFWKNTNTENQIYEKKLYEIC